jgi:cytosine deaminase
MIAKRIAAARGTLRLVGARVPARLAPTLPPGEGSWRAVDIDVSAGRIARIAPAAPATGAIRLDGIALPALADLHTHLDKTGIVARAPAPEGDLLAAIAAAERDAANWTAADIAARAEAALARAFRAGVRAMRSHVDWPGAAAPAAWRVLGELAVAWRGRVALERASLTPLDAFADEDTAEAIAGAVAASRAREGNGVLGAFVYVNDGLATKLDRLFAAAARHGLDLDFHVDETLDPRARGLAAMLDALERHRFAGRVVCGHCCALTVLPAPEQRAVIARAAAAGVTIVALPTTNLYLQDRTLGATPLRRGVTLAAELAAAGVPLAIATDNVRDCFYPYGDYDLLRSFETGLIALQLGDAARWLEAVTTVPARAMALAWDGALRPGAPADLLLFPGGTEADLASRDAERIVLRNGLPIAP